MTVCWDSFYITRITNLFGGCTSWEASNSLKLVEVVIPFLILIGLICFYFFKHKSRKNLPKS